LSYPSFSFHPPSLYSGKKDDKRGEGIDVGGKKRNKRKRKRNKKEG